MISLNKYCSEGMRYLVKSFCRNYFAKWVRNLVTIVYVCRNWEDAAPRPMPSDVECPTLDNRKVEPVEPSKLLRTFEDVKKWIDNQHSQID